MTENKYLKKAALIQHGYILNENRKVSEMIERFIDLLEVSMKKHNAGGN